MAAVCAMDLRDRARRGRGAPRGGPDPPGPGRSPTYDRHRRTQVVHAGPHDDDGPEGAGRARRRARSAVPNRLPYTAGAGEGRGDAMTMGAGDGQSDGTDRPPASWRPLRLDPQPGQTQAAPPRRAPLRQTPGPPGAGRRSGRRAAEHFWPKVISRGSISNTLRRKFRAMFGAPPASSSSPPNVTRPHSPSTSQTEPALGRWGPGRGAPEKVSTTGGAGWGERKGGGGAGGAQRWRPG